jgi:resuscitation-promoting factor RpfB
MLVAPATPRSLAAVASTTANPVASVTAGPVDDTFGERAATTSRSLGAGRGASSTPQDVATATASPAIAPAALAALAAPAAPAAPAPAPTPTVDDARSFALTQIGAEQFSCLDALWQHESDWDPSAENPSSGAYGIAQALPAARMASVGEDWISNPITQVSWGLEYIAGRYGSACNAWSFWQRHYPHWY